MYAQQDRAEHKQRAGKRGFADAADKIGAGSPLAPFFFNKAEKSRHFYAAPRE